MQPIERLKPLIGKGGSLRFSTVKQVFVDAPYPGTVLVKAGRKAEPVVH